MYDDELRCNVSGSGEIKVTIEGHALFSVNLPKGGSTKKETPVKGFNLICAAVSFSALTLLRSITIIAGINPDYTIKDGFMEFRVHVNALGDEQNAIIRVLLESFLIGMLDMKKKYPDVITIRTTAENK